MKKLNIFIILMCTTQLVAQYENYIFGSKMGATISLDEEGNGSSFGVDFEKHLGLGLYGSLSYSQGYMTRGVYLDYDNLEGGRIFQAENMRQYSSYGVGLKKVLRLSPRNDVSLSFTGLQIFQRIVSWDLAENTGERTIDLDRSQEQYGKRTDLGFLVSINFMHELSSNIDLGFYVDYLSHPKLVHVGLRSLMVIGKQVDINKATREQELANFLSCRLNVFGGDGTDLLLKYELEYDRKIKNFLSFYAKFSSGQKHRDNDLFNLSDSLNEDEVEKYNELFIHEDSEESLLWMTPIHSRLFGLGLRAVVNGDLRSELSLAAGLVYYQASVVRGRSKGSKTESWQETFNHYSSILPEFSMHYNYLLTDTFFVGTKVSLALGRFNFGVGLHGGVKF